MGCTRASVPTFGQARAAAKSLERNCSMAAYGANDHSQRSAGMWLPCHKDFEHSHWSSTICQNAETLNSQKTSKDCWRLQSTMHLEQKWKWMQLRSNNGTITARRRTTRTTTWTTTPSPSPSSSSSSFQQSRISYPDDKKSLERLAQGSVAWTLVYSLQNKPINNRLV